MRPAPTVPIARRSQQAATVVLRKAPLGTPVTRASRSAVTALQEHSDDSWPAVAIRPETSLAFALQALAAGDMHSAKEHALRCLEVGFSPTDAWEVLHKVCGTKGSANG